MPPELAVILSWAILLTMSLLVCLLLLTVAMHVWWFVPFVPTPHSVVRAMVNLAQPKKGDTVYDLGAGDARMLIMAKKMCPGIRAIGYEVAIGVWILGKIRIWLSGENIELRFGSFMSRKVSDATVILVYLSPEFMASLLPKFKEELKPGTRIVSHAFTFKDRKPDSVRSVQNSLTGETSVYLYRWVKSKNQMPKSN